MALDLNDKKAVDYSGQDDWLPTVDGTFQLDLLGYIELEEGEGEGKAYSGDCDVATVKVDSFTPTDPSQANLVNVGGVYALYFRRGNFKNPKQKPFAAARLRQFIAAAVGENPKAGTFDGNAARKSMLETDLSAGGVKIRASRKVVQNDGSPYANDTYSAVE